MMDQPIIEELASRYPSFYLYEETELVQRAGGLKSAFPEAELLYSVKCNPFPPVLDTVFRQGFGADAASVGEVQAAVKQGLDASRIFYSAPGKSKEEMASVFPLCNMVADSLYEIGLMEQIAAEKGIALNAGLRINPDFSIGPGSGMPSKFGVDETEALRFMAEMKGHPVRINGIHVHLKSQLKDEALLLSYYRSVLELAEKAEKQLGYPLDYVNLGSGIGTAYGPGKEEFDIDLLGQSAAELFRNFRETHPGTRILIESGRYVASSCGTYVTRVMDRKVSRGKTYLILHDTLNGFIRPSLERMISHYTDAVNPAGTEPLFSGKRVFDYTTPAKGPEETVTLVGRLCTAADVIAEDILLPEMHPGDLLMISHAGAYARVLSPMQFSSMTAPAQVFLKKDGSLTLE